jgi:hypothetical protein
MTTFGAHEAKIYYVQESSYGVTPANPNMLGIRAESVEAPLNSGLIQVRGVGSRDLQALRKGLRQVALKIGYPLPSDSPIGFLQHVQTLNSLSIELVYEKSDVIVDLLHVGCRIDKVTVSCSVEEVVKATVDLLAKDFLVSNSKVTGATYADYAGAVPFFESYVKRGAADGTGLALIDRVTDWSFTIENNFKRVPVIRRNQSSSMDADAASGQKVVSVADASVFKAGDIVKISDDNASEWNIVNAVDTTNNDLTMLNNLAYSYTVAANGKVEAHIGHVLKYLPERHRNLSGEVTFEFESKQEFDDIVNDAEFSLEFGLGGANKALFKHCKWENVNTPITIEDLVALKARFVARDVLIS